MSNKRTLRYIAWQVSTGLLDRDMYQEAWSGACQFLYALTAFVLRALMLITFPVSVPALWWFLRFMEPINQKRRKARNEKARQAYLESVRRPEE